ncbi:MAG: type I-E CRISPR-associated protein Cse2/CasB [Eubacteriales bacterium]|nr:type I-E CRISPR-associated protein Cse2/CasB [Eubacteriales bacterium]
MSEERDKQISAFLERLDALSTGERAVLKRSAGKMLHEVDGRAIAAFYKCYPPESERKQEKWFAVACIYCMWDWSKEEQKAISLQDILSDLRKEKTISESMQHRLTSLLDLKWDRDGYLLTKLVRIIKMVKAKRYAVDCAALLKDLLDWEWDDQRVQRRWARRFYQEAPTEE